MHLSRSLGSLLLLLLLLESWTLLESRLTLRRKLRVECIGDVKDGPVVDRLDESFLLATVNIVPFILVLASLSTFVFTFSITTSSMFTNTRLTGFGAKSMTFLTSCNVRRFTGNPPTSLNSLPTLSVVAICVSCVTVLTKIAPERLRLSVNPGAEQPLHRNSTVRGAEASGSENSDDDVEKKDEEEKEDEDEEDEGVDEHDVDSHVRRRRLLVLTRERVCTGTGEALMVPSLTVVESCMGVSSEIWYWKKKLEEVVDVRFVVGDEGSSGSTCSLDGKMANARNLVRCHGQSRDRV
uniref:RxLR effector candidate protein n=1 Tax=Hyaloperonospora arabidopsidis (strain Emoy2) TaxID=559515 RepID=M4BWW7_HYAAE